VCVRSRVLAGEPLNGYLYNLVWTLQANSTYELSRNEQFVFTNIARTNTFRLKIHLRNTEPRVYEHFNKFNDKAYLTKNQLNLQSTYEHQRYNCNNSGHYQSSCLFKT
jgi:hypothetical protein